MAGRMEDAKISTPRPLTTEELELLNWLLARGLPEAKTFAPQVKKIRASRWCDCGCPSIALHVDEGAPLGTSSNRVIADVDGMTSEGKRIGVLLFQKDGRLTILEVYSMDIIEGDWGFPVIGSLQKYEGSDLSTLKGPRK
jgi:hypothetical protein